MEDIELRTAQEARDSSVLRQEITAKIKTLSSPGLVKTENKTELLRQHESEGQVLLLTRANTAAAAG